MPAVRPAAVRLMSTDIAARGSTTTGALIHTSCVPNASPRPPGIKNRSTTSRRDAVSRCANRRGEHERQTQILPSSRDSPLRNLSSALSRLPVPAMVLCLLALAYGPLASQGRGTGVEGDGVSAAAKLLDRLDRPKQTRPGSWVAGCPCCQSKRGRPISVRETAGGRILLYAFCGCPTESVLAALGLTMSDLFEKPLGHQLTAPHSGVPASDRLAIIDHEVTVATLILEDVLRERTADEAQWKRLAEAAARIGRARDHGRA